MAAYYNENNNRAVAVLSELIRRGLIADGDVDDRSIEDVEIADVQGYTQAHWFAGVGGWSLALRRAGWDDDRPIWTGSCPCQRFSSATRGRGVATDRWPDWRRLIVAGRPGAFLGEQVSAAESWLDGVCADVAPLGYEIGAAILPAVAVGQDHARPRIYFIGHAHGDRESVVPINAEVAGVSRRRSVGRGVLSSNGVSADVALRGLFGNAIVPELAAVFIGAYMDVVDSGSVPIGR